MVDKIVWMDGKGIKFVTKPSKTNFQLLLGSHAVVGDKPPSSVRLEMMMGSVLFGV